MKLTDWRVEKLRWIYLKDADGEDYDGHTTCVAYVPGGMLVRCTYYEDNSKEQASPALSISVVFVPIKEEV